MKKDERSIILIPNQPPQLVGAWTVGEILQMAQLLAGYVNGMTVSAAKPDAPDAPEQDSPPPD